MHISCMHVGVNNITSIASFTFENFTKLVGLKLTDHTITTITYTAFRNSKFKWKYFYGFTGARKFRFRME
jgi:hypothetical protein